jgi:hypothetical protein
MSEKSTGLWPTPTTPRPRDDDKTAGKYYPSQNQKDLVWAVHQETENDAPPVSNQLTLFAEDSHVSLLVLPGSDEARMMTVTSGRNLSALLQRSDPVGLLLKMCLVSERFTSTKCYLTWKGWATPLKRSLFRLWPSMPNIDEIDSGLWLTPHGEEKNPGPNGGHLTSQVKQILWRTPNAWNAEQGPKSKENYEKAQKVGHTLITLTDQVRHEKGKMPNRINRRLWLTPSATNIDMRSEEALKRRKEYRESIGRNTVQPGNLAEQVQAGYPATDIYPTPSARDWRSGKASEETMDRNSRPLNEVVVQNEKLWATPQVRDHRSGKRVDSETSFQQLNTEVWQEEGRQSGSLNPTWVEWLQGFPLHWTEL